MEEIKRIVLLSVTKKKGDWKIMTDSKRNENY